MVCYYCMEQGQEVKAVALCHWCSGAICPNHVLEARYPSPATALMAPQPPRREFVCQRCWEEHTRPTTPSQPTRGRMLGHRDDALPTAAEAPQLVEAYLRGDYPSRQRQFWPRLRALWALLVCRLNFTRRATQEETPSAR